MTTNARDGTTDNILFNLPLDERRYQKTLEVSGRLRRPDLFGTRGVIAMLNRGAWQVCALLNDLNILEDGDESEIGERGVRARL